MRRKQNQLTLTLATPIILALISLGCGLTGRLAELRGEPAFAPTRTPMPTFTPTPAGAAFIEVPVASEAEAPADPVSAELVEFQNQPPAEGTAPEAEVEPAEPVEEPAPEESAPAPEAGAEPASENEAAPAPEAGAEPVPEDETPTATVLQNMNVRDGPGTNYPVVGAGDIGDSFTIVGRNADTSWVQVEFTPNNSPAWLYSELVEVSGAPDTMPVVQVDPPPPIAAPPPEPEPAAAADAPPPEPAAPQYQFTPGAWHASPNAAIVHFKGRITDEAGNLVNGYSVRIDNWAWSAVSHPTGASHWYPEKGDGEWDVSGVPLGSAQGWWWLSVVRYECDFFNGFDAQCKNFTTLSEEIKIHVQTPEESVINADWVCHWDCDKGLYTEGFVKPD